MRWWMWLLIVPGVLIVLLTLLVLAAYTFRRGVRRQFVAYLREAYPQFEVVRQGNARLDVRTADGVEGELYLHKLYDAVADQNADDSAARRPVFENFARAVVSGHEEEMRELDPAKDASRVMPRLVTAGFLRHLPPDAHAPRRPLGNTGLFVAYVLDSELRVNYVSRQHVEELKLADEDALHALALANLRKVFAPDTVRAAAEQGELSVIKSMDTYDAARLLLVPENLRDGEAVVAAVPDRDTLALVAMPREQAKAFPMTPDNTDHLLLDKPLWVTRNGIELA